MSQWVAGVIGDPQISDSGITKSVVGLSSVGVPLTEGAGSCGREGVGVSTAAFVGAGAGSGAGAGTNIGCDGTGGGETKTVLSTFSLARAWVVASLSAFCCFRIRSTIGRPS